MRTRKDVENGMSDGMMVGYRAGLMQDKIDSYLLALFKWLESPSYESRIALNEAAQACNKKIMQPGTDVSSTFPMRLQRNDDDAWQYLFKTYGRSIICKDREKVFSGNFKELRTRLFCHLE